MFNGTITFENTVGLDDVKIFPGHRQSILQLKRLSGSLEGVKESRYRDQKGETLSK